MQVLVRIKPGEASAWQAYPGIGQGARTSGCTPLGAYTRTGAEQGRASAPRIPILTQYTWQVKTSAQAQPWSGQRRASQVSTVKSLWRTTACSQNCKANVCPMAALCPSHSKTARGAQLAEV